MSAVSSQIANGSEKKKDMRMCGCREGEACNDEQTGKKLTPVESG